MIVLCAKMSLDQIEGTWEEISCPIVSSSYKALLTAEDRGRRKASLGMSSIRYLFPTYVPVVCYIIYTTKFLVPDFHFLHFELRKSITIYDFVCHLQIHLQGYS